MKVRLRFFSTLKRHFPEGERLIEIRRPRRAREIFEGLFETPETAAKFLPFTRFAVDFEYVSSETVIERDCELAFIPPVSGG